MHDHGIQAAIAATNKQAVNATAAYGSNNNRGVHDAAATASNNHGIPDATATGADNHRIAGTARENSAGAATRTSSAAERAPARTAHGPLLALILDFFREGSHNAHLEFKELAPVFLSRTKYHEARLGRLLNVQ